MPCDEPAGRMTRRRLLQTGLAGAGAKLASRLAMGSMITMPFIGRAVAAGPIILGMLLPKSGPYARRGRDGNNGASIAIEDFGGRVLNRPVKLIWLDEPGPDTAQRNMRRLVEQEGAIAVQGGVSSSNVLAVMRMALQYRVPLIATGPNGTEITGRSCNRYSFRIDLPNRVTLRAVDRQLGASGRRWHFLSGSYAWGVEASSLMKERVAAAGGIVLGEDWAEAGNADFSAVLSKIRASRPDILFLGLAGPDLANCLARIREAGLSRDLQITAPILRDSDLWAAGPENARGLYPKLWHYADPKLADRSRQFVSKYVERYETPPGTEAWQDWFATTALLTAIRETGSTSSADLVGFLESHRFEGFKDQPIWFRDFDHQLIQPLLMVRVNDQSSDPLNSLEIIDRCPQQGSDLAAWFGTSDEIGCSLGDA